MFWDQSRTFWTWIGGFESSMLVLLIVHQKWVHLLVRVLNQIVILLSLLFQFLFNVPINFINDLCLMAVFISTVFSWFKIDAWFYCYGWCYILVQLFITFHPCFNSSISKLSRPFFSLDECRTLQPFLHEWFLANIILVDATHRRPCFSLSNIL